MSQCFHSQQSRYAVGPSTIVMGTPQPGFNKPRLPFGLYAMVYVGTKNNMTNRSVPAIALQESNHFGGFYFMSPKTGKHIHSNKWSQLPIREGVAEKVQHLADCENQPKMKTGELLFEWEPGLEVFDHYKIVSL